MVTAAAGAAVRTAPEKSRRTTASVAHANGAAMGASGSPWPPSQVSGLTPMPDTAPRAVAASMTGAAGADAAASGAAIICSASTADTLAGPLSADGSVESLTAATGSRASRVARVASTLLMPGTGRGVADRRAVPLRPGAAAGDASALTGSPEFVAPVRPLPVLDGAEEPPEASSLLRAPRFWRAGEAGAASVVADAVVSSAAADTVVSESAPVSAAAMAGNPANTAPTPNRTASAPTRPTWLAERLL